MKQAKISEILLSLQEHVLKIKDDVADIKEKMVTKEEFYIVTDALMLTLKNFTKVRVSSDRNRIKKLEEMVFKK